MIETQEDNDIDHNTVGQVTKGKLTKSSFPDMPMYVDIAEEHRWMTSDMKNEQKILDE